jgi:hypothetical protein
LKQPSCDRRAVAGIVTHLVDIEQKESLSRTPEAIGYYGYYGFVANAYRDPGHSTERTTVWLETKLYDVATESLIWAAESKSWNVASDRQVTADVIDAAVRDLIACGAVAPRSAAALRLWPRPAQNDAQCRYTMDRASAAPSRRVNRICSGENDFTAIFSPPGRGRMRCAAPGRPVPYTFLR